MGLNVGVASTEVHALADLARSPTVAFFEGARHGGGTELSFYVTAWGPGEGPGLHLHPYAEVFLVERGRAGFRSGDEELVADAGHVVVVPPETAHRFWNSGDERLEVTSIHPAAKVETTWL